MMNLDVYSMATTRRLDVERELRRREQLRLAGVGQGPTLVSRLAGLAARVAHRERGVRPTPATPISCLTTRPHGPV